MFAWHSNGHHKYKLHSPVMHCHHYMQYSPQSSRLITLRNPHSIQDRMMSKYPRSKMLGRYLDKMLRWLHPMSVVACSIPRRIQYNRRLLYWSIHCTLLSKEYIRCRWRRQMYSNHHHNGIHRLLEWRKAIYKMFNLTPEDHLIQGRYHRKVGIIWFVRFHNS